jgi:hypothetical protein
MRHTTTLSQLRHNNHLEVKAAHRLRFWVTLFISCSLGLVLASFALTYFRYENAGIACLCLALAGMASAAMFGKKKR